MVADVLAGTAFEDTAVEGAFSLQELESLMRDGVWEVPRDKTFASRIQPASFDPVIDDRVCRVPHGFRPQRDVSIEESLRRLPKDDYKWYDCSSGQVVYTGFSWLFSLPGNFRLPQGFRLKSSPKSTHGRLGNFVRLIADGTPKFDEVKGPWEGRLGIVVEPRVWNHVVYPGIAFNQLRIFHGDAVLSDAELRREMSKHGFLFDESGNRVPISQAEVDEGMLLSVDLEGRATDGLIGFKARRNPEPIDLRKVRELPPLEYLEPLTAPKDGVLMLSPLDLFILASRERVRCPPDFAAELQRFASEHGEVIWHDAGFFDPGFGWGEAGERNGSSAVLEVISRESGLFPIRHGDSCSRLVYEWMRGRPREIYGGKKGSTYHDQVGAWFAKPFALPKGELGELARRAYKDKEPVFVVDRRSLFNGDSPQGFFAFDKSTYDRIICNGYMYRRGDAEQDPSRKQPIPYVVVVEEGSKKVLVYERASDIKTYGETRLHGKLSIGYGGHVRPVDSKGADVITATRDREFREELDVRCEYRMSSVLGFLHEDQNHDVCKVHFGVVYIAWVKDISQVKPRDPEIHRIFAVSPDKLADLPRDNLECWSQMLIDPLKELIKGG